MRKKRTIIQIICLFCFMLLLVACGRDNQTNNENETSEGVTPTLTQSPTIDDGKEGVTPTLTQSPTIDDGKEGEDTVLQPIVPPSFMPEELPVLTLPPEVTEGQGVGDIALSNLLVSSTEELLENIAPHAALSLAPGLYSMTEFLDTVSVEDWNDTHTYVKLREVFDGVEIVIQNVDDLSIFGDNENLTELVVDPRYATVLSFENCNDLFLMGLVMGHTDRGDCTGDVLRFASCSDITLSSMDLYGCGVYGIHASEGTTDLYVYSSTIRDCEYGPLFVTGCKGNFEFKSCFFTGSEGSGYCEENRDFHLSFVGCVFGDNETAYYLFRENTVTEDCQFSDDFIYPEYPEDAWLGEFDPDKMEESKIEQEHLSGRALTGYSVVNMENGETTKLPEEFPDGTFHGLYFLFDADGTGSVEDRYTNKLDLQEFVWSCEKDGESVKIQYEDGRAYYLSRWLSVEDDTAWYSLFVENYCIWLY